MFSYAKTTSNSNQKLPWEFLQVRTFEPKAKKNSLSECFEIMRRASFTFENYFQNLQDLRCLFRAGASCAQGGKR